MTKIFISYRRDDAPDMAERIYERLEHAFGKGNIFIDVDDIPSGVRFAEYLSQTLAKSDAMLVIIGERWLTATTTEGKRRLEQPGDFVRLEVESALQRELALIPALVQGASVPVVTDLPESLRGLVAHQALSVRRNPDFERDMTRLIDALRQRVRQQARQRAADRRRRRWAAVNQTLMQAPRIFSWLVTQPVGRISAFVTAVMLVLVSTAVLLQSGTLRSLPVLGSFGSSTSTATPSPTLNATAATHAAAVVQATATSEAATATAVFVAPYMASLPGKCDQGGATWDTHENNGQFPGTMSCPGDSMVVRGNAFTEFQGIPGHAGYSSTGIPPLHYRASVDAALDSNGSYGNPGLSTHFDAILYNLSVEPDGHWMTYLSTGSQQTGGTTGQRPAAASYTLSVAAQGGAVIFSINGAQVDQIQLPSGSTQPTGVDIGNFSGGPTYFKNFVFTPLP